jgi:amino acid transporter
MSRISPFVRNLGILAVIAILIVVLNQETALVTAATLLRFAFFIVIGVVAYFFWRDIGRREIETWPARSSRVFYAAVGLFVLDVGWWVVIGVTGRDVLAALVVGAICVYVGFTTWREQRSVL